MMKFLSLIEIYIMYLIIKILCTILYENVNRVNRFSYIEEKSLLKYAKIPMCRE